MLSSWRITASVPRRRTRRDVDPASERVLQQLAAGVVQRREDRDDSLLGNLAATRRGTLRRERLGTEQLRDPSRRQPPAPSVR